MNRERRSLISSAVFAVTLVVGALLTNLTGGAASVTSASTTATAAVVATST